MRPTDGCGAKAVSLLQHEPEKRANETSDGAHQQRQRRKGGQAAFR
jgi:hypothetical protein